MGKITPFSKQMDQMAIQIIVIKTDVWKTAKQHGMNAAEKWPSGTLVKVALLKGGLAGKKPKHSN